MKKLKPKFKVDNTLKYFGDTDTKTGVVRINWKKHKRNKQELANTIKHELYHVKHPRAHEKTVYKKVKGEIHGKEASKLLKKLTKSAMSA